MEFLLYETKATSDLLFTSFQLDISRDSISIWILPFRAHCHQYLLNEIEKWLQSSGHLSRPRSVNICKWSPQQLYPVLQFGCHLFIEWFIFTWKSSEDHAWCHQLRTRHLHQWMSSLLRRQLAGRDDFINFAAGALLQTWLYYSPDDLIHSVCFQYIENHDSYQNI